MVGTEDVIMAAMSAAFVLDATLEGFDEARLCARDLRFVCEVDGAYLIAVAFEDAVAHTD
jgi:hypothetical protein